MLQMTEVAANAGYKKTIWNLKDGTLIEMFHELMPVPRVSDIIVPLVEVLTI